MEDKTRVVAFDVDGTLLKGLHYSWSILWQAIGGESEQAKKVRKQFMQGKISYPDWCEADCQELKKGGLTQEKVKLAIRQSGTTLTKNLRNGIAKLKQYGFKVVIISGGADCVLQSFLPDLFDLFDEVWMNRFIFNEKTGILDTIIPTPYDWDDSKLGVKGKRVGFETVCEKYGANAKDSVFVGDDENDFSAMQSAGMKIYYNTDRLNAKEKAVGLPERVMIIDKDDLSAVVEEICVWSKKI